MNEILDVNWLIVLVSGFIAFSLGSIWYSQSFLGKRWMQGLGTAAVPGRSLGMLLVAQLISSLLFAWSVAVAFNVSVVAAILVAVTFSAMLKTNGLFSGKTMFAIGTEAGYVLVQGAIVIGALLIFA